MPSSPSHAPICNTGCISAPVSTKQRWPPLQARCAPSQWPCSPPSPSKTHCPPPKPGLASRESCSWRPGASGMSAACHSRPQRPSNTRRIRTRGGKGSASDASQRNLTGTLRWLRKRAEETSIFPRACKASRSSMPSATYRNASTPGGAETSAGPNAGHKPSITSAGSRQSPRLCKGQMVAPGG